MWGEALGAKINSKVLAQGRHPHKGLLVEYEILQILALCQALCYMCHTFLVFYTSWQLYYCPSFTDED